MPTEKLLGRNALRSNPFHPPSKYLDPAQGARSTSLLILIPRKYEPTVRFLTGALKARPSAKMNFTHPRRWCAQLAGHPISFDPCLSLFGQRFHYFRS